MSMTSSAENPDTADVYFLGCSASKTQFCSLFRLVSTITAAGATVVILTYHLIGKRFEAKLLKNLEEASASASGKPEKDELDYGNAFPLFNAGNFARTAL